MTSTLLSAQDRSLTGRVTNPQGGPVASAEISVRALPPIGVITPTPMRGMPGMGVAERTTRSRGDGAFAFDRVGPGAYVLQVDAPGFERWSQEVIVSNGALPTVEVRLVTREVLAGDTVVGDPSTNPGRAVDTQTLLDRIAVLEQRINDLESSAVLSEPETRVKRLEIFVDQNGNEHDAPVPGAKKAVTYQRERVYRRQTINEKLEEALADAENRSVKLGISAASVTQFSGRTKGPASEADGHAYQLASADLFFSAGLAQYTSFFADVVGLSGAPPDNEIHGLTLLNSYTARLVRQNELNLREAWLRTELFSQKLAISAGRLDLTNYFDRNVAANDETSQFVSDALVNNPALGLASNGAGFAAVFDAKTGVAFKVGLQQSNPDATNLSQSIYTLAEVDYIAKPFALPEGNYRLWYRADNNSVRHRNGVGVSVDQKVTPALTLFGRFGSAQADVKRDEFVSVGVQFQDGVVFNPLDTWGVGYSQLNLDDGDREKLAEGYYNVRLSERLRLSLHLQHVFEAPAGAPSRGFLVPAVRLQATF